MADSELDALLVRFRKQLDGAERVKKRQQVERELPLLLRGECDRVASFCQDRLVVAPGRASDEGDFLDQWAWEWRALHEWLTRAGLDERLQSVGVGDDSAVALAVKWLQKASERGGLDALARSMKSAVEKPELIHGVLKALRELPDRLLPEAQPAAVQPPELVATAKSMTQGDGSSQLPPRRCADLPSKEALAITYLGLNPKWTDERIAKEVGVHRSTLYRWKRYGEAKARMGKHRVRLPKGYKDRDRGLEAYREDDDEDD